MRLVAPDQSEEFVYSAIDTAVDRIVLWKGDDGAWWAVVRTDGQHVTDGNGENLGVGIIECAFLLDRSERGDAAIIRWADKAKARGAHPEDELDAP